MNKLLKPWLMIAGLFWLINPLAYSHCQIPCGIYDDHAKVQEMLQDVATARKAISQIQNLSGKSDPQSANQLVRWVMNKEQHAQHIITTISGYFLTQRVKTKQKDYNERLARHHAVIVNAMKVKQNADIKYVDELEKSVKALADYYPEHSH
ncbi:superoxide dismutase [Neiella sp. HB171785]|uniref:Superoxide dismutase n=1 Tax=Neiella litorisoli TaxID=2771431 RepID=A0A8J6UII1_9GAMM|nr:superoxide dismutase [Ni] [Neiella litorisoli]MBD1388503.1 superoxide dismutase [Neiella litorisoli]